MADWDSSPELTDRHGMLEAPLDTLSIESKAWLPLMGICGMLLLMVGGLVVRLGAVAIGLSIGGIAGWLLWSEAQLTVPSWLLMTACCLVTIGMALLLTRFFTAVAHGIILSLWVLGWMNAWLQLHSTGSSLQKPLPTMLTEMLLVESSFELTDDSMPPSASDVSLSENVHVLFENARDAWESLSETWSLIAVFGISGSLIIGMLLGLVMPRPAAMSMSCGWGGLLVLIALIGLFAKTGSTGPWQSGIATMLIWSVLSVSGIAIQRMLRRNKPVGPQA